MRSSDRRLAGVVAFALVLCATVATTSGALASGYNPRVPVSMLSTPSWFDPSRLRMATSITMGGGYGGTGGLSVTSFSYRFGSPLDVSVNLGNAFGGGVSRSGSGFFLEGVDVTYRPRPNMVFQVHYQDIRSPLQYGLQSPSSLWGP